MADLVDLAHLQCHYETLETFRTAVANDGRAGVASGSTDADYSPYIVSAAAVMAWHSFLSSVTGRQLEAPESNDPSLLSLIKIRDRWSSVLAHLLVLPPLEAGARWFERTLAAQEQGTSDFLLPTFRLTPVEKSLAMLVAEDATRRPSESATGVRQPFLVHCPLPSRLFALNELISHCEQGGALGGMLGRFKFLKGALRARSVEWFRPTPLPVAETPSPVRLAAVELSKAVAESRVLAVTETFKVPSSVYDATKAEGYVTAALTLKPSASIEGTVLEPTAPAARNVVCGPLAPLIAVLHSHRHPSASGRYPFPPFLSRDGSKITSSFGGLLLTDAARNQLHCSDDDRRWLEAAYSSVVSALSSFMHQIGERSTAPAVHAMLPVVNDALRVASLLGIDARMLLVTAAIENYRSEGATKLRSQFVINNQKQKLVGSGKQRSSGPGHTPIAATDDEGTVSRVVTMAVTSHHPCRDLSMKLMLHIAVAYKRMTSDIRAIITKAVGDVYRSEEVMKSVFKKADARSKAQKGKKEIKNDGTRDEKLPQDMEGPASHPSLDPLLLEASPFAQGLLMLLVHPIVSIASTLPSNAEAQRHNVGTFVIACAIKETLIAIDTEMVYQVTSKSGLSAIGTGKWADLLAADRRSILKYVANAPLLDFVGDLKLVTLSCVECSCLCKLYTESDNNLFVFSYC